MTRTDIIVAERVIAGRRAAVRFAFQTWRAWPPGSEARSFWRDEIIEAERRLSHAEGMPAHIAPAVASS
jgi:hypothetical protein